MCQSIQQLYLCLLFSDEFNKIQEMRLSGQYPGKNLLFQFCKELKITNFAYICLKLFKHPDVSELKQISYLFEAWRKTNICFAINKNLGASKQLIYT